MATLNETNGPSNALRGVMPSLPDERDGRSHWLVFDCTNIYAVHTTSVDIARALVLDRFGYGDRPDLAERLDARPASQGEITAVCSRKRQKPLKVDHRNATRIGKLARAIYLSDLRHERSDPGTGGTGGAGSIQNDKMRRRAHNPPDALRQS